MHRSLSRAWVLSLLFLVPAVSGAVLLADRSPQSAASPGAAAQPGAAPHIYRVSAFRAAPGHFRDLEKLLTSTPQPGADAGDLALVFRHRQGNEWDFMTIEHMGPQATISAGATAPQPDSPFSQMAAWHGDTYAAGPPLDEFRRALNITGAQAPGGVYIISDYQAAAGHRGALRQALDQIAADAPGRTVLLSHVEGAPWNFLAIQRYDSWRQLADEEEKEMKEAAGGGAADMGVQLRDSMAVHHDTIATIGAVVGGR
jgi:hypothetical protein